MQIMSTLTHHGIIFVPFGYKHAMPLLSRVDEAHGGSPWGAGCIAVRLPATLPPSLFGLTGFFFVLCLVRVPMPPVNLVR